MNNCAGECALPGNVDPGRLPLDRFHDLGDDPAQEPHTEADANRQGKDGPQPIDDGARVGQEAGEIQTQRHGIYLLSL